MEAPPVVDRKEVESHSSQVTNKRIGDIKDVMWRKSLEVMSNRANPFLTLDYFSILVIHFLETPGLYSDDDLKKLKLEFKDGNWYASKIRMYGNPSVEDVENLVQICLRLHDLMNNSLQRLRYLFRTGSQDAKGLDAALDVFQKEIWKKQERPSRDKNAKTNGVYDAPAE